MPQLDTTTWPPQLIWLAIAFIGLYLIMRFVALPRVGGAIESRSKRVADDLEAAQRFKTETERAIADYEAALAAARARGSSIAQEARDRLNAETAKERAKVEAEIKAQTAKAEQTIAALKKKAMGEVEKVAADVAAEIVTELAGIEVKVAEGKAAASLAEKRKGKQDRP
jgi:F-type H+-transporting ATPase subunit b